MPRRNDEQPNCCRCCTGFLFSSGLTAVLLWLTLKPSSPKYSIESFYVPVLNKTSTSQATVNSTTISFDLRLKNENRNKGIYYDALDLTFFFYFPENSSFLRIGDITIPEFYQGHLKTAHRLESIQSYGVSWKDAKTHGSSTKMFRVDLDTRVRYKIMLSRTKRHRMRLGVNVTVNNEGAKSVDRGLRFSSAASHFNGLTTLLVGVS
ncbi:hypothetical protein C5167_007027 [Papaver somniferum]|uniref:Late embryogenesis abundant protein LEA-2 subgroup domain-containing protein n=1 Tax=Papaver somniferum TaxID=3469 RepID=A0A4Y7JFZ8_PAPSO|nr:hypothetical protein C5167_007027 [Papaver somniferum]